MKIKGRLVFDKHSGKLIGFTSLGDPDLDFSTFENLEVATHALAIMVRGMQATLKFMLAYFLTQTVVSYQLAPLFWRAVAILELNCNLHVIATSSDGMSANRKFYWLRKLVTGEKKASKILNHTMNLLAPQRSIWFFADVPDLMKTTKGEMFKKQLILTGKLGQIFFVIRYNFTMKYSKRSLNVSFGPVKSMEFNQTKNSHEFLIFLRTMRLICSKCC